MPLWSLLLLAESLLMLLLIAPAFVPSGLCQLNMAVASTRLLSCPGPKRDGREALVAWEDSSFIAEDEDEDHCAAALLLSSFSIESE